MTLIQLLLAMDPGTVVSVQRNTFDDESMFTLKPAHKFELGEIRGYEVVEFYPERYNAGYVLGITVIVKEVTACQ